ncbi:MAG: ABC transporter ATP-binding protein [Deinococcales bacterium]
MAEPILKVEHADLGYGELQVVFDVSLEVGPTELIGLVGGNGSGKSTMLRAISGMLEPWKGKVIFHGQDITGLKPHQIAAIGIAHIPMGRQLFADMTVEDNLSLGAYLPGARQKRKESFERVYGLFPDLMTKRKAMAGSLSGGQQQMVAIARGLMLDPKMILMDEPSLGLSPLLVKEVMQAIRIVSQTGLPILLVEQNVKQVLNVSDRAYVLENGHLVVEGPSKALMDDQRVKKAYLGL